ncbi:MAG TPA: GMC oxidoreductase [Candidatus Binatia bacterium]|jgi:pyranose oxidase|nr:GMC oxidoreductase [Candidatus Binatia bacterium]
MSSQNCETDVLIIGSGPIGATYARFLVSQGKRVVMIDAGPQLSARPGWHLVNSFRYQHTPNLSVGAMYAHREVYSIPGSVNFQNPEQNPDLNMADAAAAYAVGGMFNFWSGFAPTPALMERTPLIPPDEWEPLLRIAHRLFNTHTDAFEPSAVNRAIQKVLLENGRPVKNISVGAEKRSVNNTYELAHLVTWTGTDTVLGPLVDSPEHYMQKFTLLPEHRAEKLETKEHKVCCAVVRDLATFETKRIHAETFVIAAGPFSTPRLLWVSGIRPWALGRYLHEHTVADCRIRLHKKIEQMLRDDPENPARSSDVPIAWNDPSPKSGFTPSEDRPWAAHLHRTGRAMTYDDWRDIDVRLTLDLKWFGMVEPIPTNRVLFSEERMDRFGMPQITIEYRLSEEDQDQASRMMADMKEIAQLLGDSSFIKEPKFQGPGSSFHLMGTFRMGSDRQTSVVDENSKVWEYENIYLGGLGVMPSKMASNPTLTACALAARSVGRILGCPIERLEEELTHS